MEPLERKMVKITGTGYSGAIDQQLDLNLPRSAKRINTAWALRFTQIFNAHMNINAMLSTQLFTESLQKRSRTGNKHKIAAHAGKCTSKGFTDPHGCPGYENIRAGSFH